MAHEPEGVVWLHAERRITLVELSRSCGLAEQVVRDLVEYGALQPADPAAPAWEFAAARLPALRAAARLLGDLDLEPEPPALGLVMSFLQRIEGLEAEVRELRARLVEPRP
ncbi:MAG TPA: chaperone modulator CbpM [Myxococcota bacterium]|nr:chaperone modulator CbpM [Myxococcota bacterium]